MGLEKETASPNMHTAVAAVVPCYNAGPRIRPVLERLVQILTHVIVVDDGSTDNLRRNIEGLDVTLVSFPVNRGKGHALIEGMRTARRMESVSCVATLDSDGQHDPNEIPRLYRVFCDNKADLVIGSRVFDRRQVPWHSRFGNKLTIGLTTLLLGKRLPDTQSGYRLHSARLVDHILAAAPGGRYETEMEVVIRAIRGGFLVVPVPIQTVYERGSQSSHFHVFRDSALIYKTLFRIGLFAGVGKAGRAVR